MTAWPPGAETRVGIGWREAVSRLVLRRPDLGFVEVLAESLPPERSLPLALDVLVARGVPVIPHGVRLSLGGAERPDPRRLAGLARLARRVAAPLVSEHVAFVRAGGVETGHLLPVPLTRDCLEVVVENVRIAQEHLPVPLALENIAAVFRWPDAEMDEATFLTELLERSGALLLLDVANLYANARNLGFDPLAYLDRLPLDRLAYVHVAGGAVREGIYEDTHAHPVPSAALALLEEVARRVPIPAVMLERDDRFPGDEEVAGELDAIARAASAPGPAGAAR